jgi:hypothetical protein
MADRALGAAVTVMLRGDGTATVDPCMGHMHTSVMVAWQGAGRRGAMFGRRVCTIAECEAIAAGRQSAVAAALPVGPAAGALSVPVDPGAVIAASLRHWGAAGGDLGAAAACVAAAKSAVAGGVMNGQRAGDIAAVFAAAAYAARCTGTAQTCGDGAVAVPADEDAMVDTDECEGPTR